MGGSQIISNDQYNSVIHRVLANSSDEPRISVVMFFMPSKIEELYGPLPGLLSQEKPALFRPFTLAEYNEKFFTKQLDGESKWIYAEIQLRGDQLL